MSSYKHIDLSELTSKQLLDHFGQTKLRRTHERNTFEIVGAALSQIFYIMLPYVSAFIEFMTALQHMVRQHDLGELFPMVFGLMLCFFGGHYLILVTISETVRLFCWKELSSSVHVLRRNYEVAMSKTSKDDAMDVYGKNDLGVKIINNEDLLLRKLKVFAKSLDVAEVRSATRALATAYFSTVAALRLRMAQYLALTLSAAHAIKESSPFEAILAKNLPPEAQKWSGVIADTLLNTACMIVALLLGGCIGSLNCAIRGAHIFVHNLIALGRKKGLLEEDLHLSDVRSKALIVIITLTGFLWQMSHSTSLPFPFNVVLFPLTLFEWVLQLVVNGLVFLTPSISFP